VLRYRLIEAIRQCSGCKLLPLVLGVHLMSTSSAGSAPEFVIWHATVLSYSHATVLSYSHGQAAKKTLPPSHAWFHSTL
jgi:hypothetical protein